MEETSTVGSYNERNFVVINVAFKGCKWNFN